jgi:hypothetical protein
MNDISSREEEFHSRFERFKARMRELRGLRVNQFLGLLDHNQQRKVLLIEKEVEEFVRKFAYGGGLSPLLQESILVAFNSDQVMRKRIELQSQGKATGPGVATVQTRAARQSSGGSPKPVAVSPATAVTASVNRPGNGGNGAKSTGYFEPTTSEISRQASRLMGGKQISNRSIDALQQAISRKLGGNGNGGPSAAARQVRLSLSSAGKVSIQVDHEAGR